MSAENSFERREMRKKTLGRTGLEVSIVGLGGANLGLATPDMPVRQYIETPAITLMDTELGVSAVVTALENGATLIDTAPKYGAGGSEKIIGEALRRRPDLARNCIVTTKIGCLYSGDGYDFSYDAAMRSVEGSIDRLGKDHFSVLYLHDPQDTDAGMEFVMSDRGVMGALRKLKRDGVIDWIGLAADEPETTADYLETGEFDVATVSGAWSMICQTATRRILPAAERHTTGIVVTTAIERGLLVTGKPIPGLQYLNRNFPPDLIEHVAKLEALCREFNVPLVAVALQWATRDPRVHSAVPGGRTPEEVKMNTLAGRIAIPEELWTKISEDKLIRHWDVRV